MSTPTAFMAKPHASAPLAEKYPRLRAELEACFGEGERLMAVVRERLKGVRDGEAA